MQRRLSYVRFRHGSAVAERDVRSAGPSAYLLLRSTS